jgi:hypothetical protein
MRSLLAGLFGLTCTALHCMALHGSAWQSIGGESRTLAAAAAVWRAEATGRLAKHRRTVMSCEGWITGAWNVVVDLAMLIILAREHRALAAMAQSPRAPPLLPAQSSNICLCAVSRCPHRRATQTATPSGVRLG